jgi:hypothetical protein
MGVRFVDVINPLKWVSFAWGTMNKHLFTRPHRWEQYVVRRYMPECQPCVKNGSCLHCGCDTVAKMLTPWESCSAGWWGPYLSKVKWEEYKNAYGLKIKIEFTKSEQNEQV